MLFEQSVDGGHEFSLIFALFVKFLCLAWSAGVVTSSESMLLPAFTSIWKSDGSCLLFCRCAEGFNRRAASRSPTSGLTLSVDHLRQTPNRFLRKRLRLPQLVVRVSRTAKADSQHSIILQHVEDSAYRIT